MPAERGEAAADGDEPVQRSAVARGEQHGAGLLRARREPRRPGASRVGSCWSTRLSSSFSAGVGSSPNASTSAARPGAEHLERLRLPPGAVEGDHQLAAQALVERVVDHELLELGHELRAAAELELGLEAPLRDREAQVAQALDDRPGERLEREIGERLAPPQRERLPVERDGRRGVAGGERRAGGVREALEDRGGRACPVPRGSGSRAGGSR